MRGSKEAAGAPERKSNLRGIAGEAVEEGIEEEGVEEAEEGEDKLQLAAFFVVSVLPRQQQRLPFLRAVHLS